MSVTVEDLLKEPFSDRTEENRLKIVSNGKPRPDLTMAAVVTMTSEDADTGLSTQQFRQAMYDEVKWLTGCDQRQAFFCWPCLLFMPATGIWNTSGVGDLVYYLEAMPQHEESFEHMQAMLKLQNLIEKNAKAETFDKKQHNDIVKRNRSILRRLVDVIYNLIVKEQHYDERSHGCQLASEHVVKNLQFLGNYDVLNSNFIEDAIDMIQISPKLVDDLVDAVSKKIRMAVHKEIGDSTYVSIILSDHSKYENKCQISTVLRYFKDDKPRERFIGFTNMSDGKSIETVLEHIKHIVDEFSFSSKFNSFAMDGGIIQTPNFLEFLSRMKTEFPNAFFVQWHSHNLDSTIQQSLSTMDECRGFFKTINQIKNYFSKKSDRYKRLESFINTFHPEVKNNIWFAKSHYIQILNSERILHTYISFFDSVVQNSPMWEPADITEALGFKLILEDPNTILMVQILSTVLNIIAPLNKILKSSTNEKLFDRSALDEVCSSLQDLRDTKFDEIWAKVYDSKTGPEPPAKRIKADPECKETFCAIINRVLKEINIRFNYCAQLTFCQLLHCTELGLFTYSADRIRAFTAAHSERLDEEQIRNELTVLRTNAKVFGQKSILELSDFLIKTNLKNTFKFLFRLVEYILTLPIEAYPFPDSRWKFKDIQDWSYVPESADVQGGDISVPCVELNYLQEMKKSSFFHEEIAVVFYNVNNSFELLFR